MIIRLLFVSSVVSAVSCNIFDLFHLWHRLHIPQDPSDSQPPQYIDHQAAQSRSGHDTEEKHRVLLLKSKQHVRTALTSEMKKLILNLKHKLKGTNANNTKPVTLTSDNLPQHLKQMVQEYQTVESGSKKEEIINKEILKLTQYLKQELPMTVRKKLNRILFHLRKKLLEKERHG